MNQRTETVPHFVLGYDVAVLSKDPLVAILTVKTNDGWVDLAINRDAAKAMSEAINQVLAQAA